MLDTFGAYSEKTVKEAVIEKNVMTKSTRDDDSAEMLRLIFDTKEFETSVIFDTWGIYGQWGGMTALTNPNISSTLKSAEKSINKAIQKTIDLMQYLEE